ncbi:MAG: hypothetical protein ACRCVJ_04415 [Clostridium sp.]|uniref:hypothetical protein n=1 Tax=Clostridium sp. TaxID=1506 RepID=UPI003F32E3B2
MYDEEKYFQILSEICEDNDISREKLVEILKKKEQKYLLILFLKKYNCCTEDEIKELLKVKTRRSINYNYEKAEEKFLVNREFRNKYIQIEKKIDRII